MTLKIGDQVGYTRAFCQIMSAGDPHSPFWHHIGTVCGFEDPFVIVRWDILTEPSLAHPANIARVGTDRHCRIDAKGWVGWDSAEKTDGRAGSLFATPDPYCKQRRRPCRKSRKK